MIRSSKFRGGLPRIAPAMVRHTTVGSTDELSVENEIAKVLEENAADKVWARSPDARSVLSAGTKTPFPSQGLNEPDMDSFLMKRGFKDVTHEKNPSAHRTLTAALTFPLSLAYGINRIFHGSDIGAAIGNNRMLNILVIGARAEASLPALWWREGLINLSSEAADCGIRVGMLGPSLPPVLPTRRMKSEISTDGDTVVVKPKIRQETEIPVAEVSIPFKRNNDNNDVIVRTKQARVHHVDNGRNLLHKHPDAVGLLRDADLIVMFHPGLGHKTLKNGWKPTIELLLSSKKPVLCTAHSMQDYTRDINMLHEISSEIDDNGQELGEPLEMIFTGHYNPFASTRRTYDKEEHVDAQIVTTNELIYAFQAK